MCSASRKINLIDLIRSTKLCTALLEIFYCMKNKMVKFMSICGISWKLYEKNCHAYQWPILNLGENDNNTLWASYRAGAVEAIKVWVCRSWRKSKFFQIKLVFNKGRCQKVGVQLHTLHTHFHRPCYLPRILTGKRERPAGNIDRLHSRLSQNLSQSKKLLQWQ